MQSVYKWLLNKRNGIDAPRRDKMVAIMAREHGVSEPTIKRAMYRDIIKRGCGFTDYFRGDYFSATEEQKDTFVTSKSFYQIIKYLNDNAYYIALDDKLIFNEFFRGYLGRAFLNLREADADDLAAFLEGRETVFAKDPTGFGGHGVEKIDVSAVTDPEALYRQLAERGQFLVEEAIEQCDELNQINPTVVNSFRVVTLYKDGEAHLVGNALRVNQEADAVVGCSNDLYFSLGEDGRIDSNVIDDWGNVYEEHPLTGRRFADVRIPGVAEAFEMCRRAALKIPQVRYVGWDIAFSKDGPVMVEGNQYPGYGIIQFTKLKGERTGHLKTIRDVLGDEMANIQL